MAIEMNTNALFEDKLRDLGYFLKTEDNPIKVERQRSKIKSIDKLLSKASKSGKGGQGYPEYIITSSEDLETVMIVECKADIKDHNKAQKEVQHYMSFLTNDFNLIGIAFSGNEDKNEMTIYKSLKGNPANELLRHNGIKPFSQYIDEFDHELEIKIRGDINKFASSLNNYLRSQAKVSESDRSLVVAACLFALENKRFNKSYDENETSEDLLEDMFTAIQATFKTKGLRKNQQDAIIHNLEFMKGASRFNNKDKIDKRYPDKYPLLYTLNELKRDIYPYLKQGKDLDILGKFYSEFLKCANGDGKGLGIVLTPEHITSLFCKLADLKVDDVVVDTCTGSGAFILAAGNYMTGLTDDKDIQKNIKENNLYGIEIDSKMFTLLSTNMLIRGKNVKNLYRESTFNMVDKVYNEIRPSKALINPPYSMGGDESEFDFIDNMLDMLEPGGTGICIVPTSVASKISKSTLIKRNKLFNKHSLKAVLTMNSQLFHPVGTHPIIMIWEAKNPHIRINSDGIREIKKPTWFADWSNDGHILLKNQGRLDLKNQWKDIEKEWLKDYDLKRVKHGYSANEYVDIEDEWVVGNFLMPDWDDILDSDFSETISDFLKFNMFNNHNYVNIETNKWNMFRVGDVFNVTKGRESGVMKSPIKHNKKSKPLVGASFINNGIVGYLDQDNYKKIYSNILTVANAGDGGCATTFYQKDEIVAGSTVTVLESDNMNRYNALFIAPLISKYHNYFGHGRGLNDKRLKNLKIKLPVDNQGNPDWKYMEDYMRQKEYELLTKENLSQVINDYEKYLGRD